MSGQSAGIQAPWDLRKTLDSLSSNADRIRPVLERVKPADWKSKGAPDGYVEQHRSVLAQLRSVSVISQSLAKNPEKLTTTLDLFLRLETLDLNLQSISEGIRTYQNPAVAEMIDGMRTEGAAARSGLREYVVELANVKETEFKIADEEAQKCRTQQIRTSRRK